jgi:hypothetical protein
MLPPLRLGLTDDAVVNIANRYWIRRRLRYNAILPVVRMHNSHQSRAANIPVGSQNRLQDKTVSRASRR